MDSTTDTSRRPLAVTGLLGSSLVIGVVLVALSLWSFLASGAGPLVALFAGVPGLLLVASLVGWWRRQKWTRRVLLGGLVIGLNNAFWMALFAFITLGSGKPGFGEKLLAASLGFLTLFAVLLFVLRTAAVNQHLWAVEMGRMGRTPDEELLEDVAFDVAEKDADER